MQKLTKEQFDYLWNKIHSAGWIVGSSQGQKVLEILCDFTQEEFPKFEVGDIFVDVDERDDSMISISFSDSPSSDAYWSLTKEGFKQFTEGCNKIVEWIKEQE